MNVFSTTGTNTGINTYRSRTESDNNMNTLDTFTNKMQTIEYIFIFLLLNRYAILCLFA